MNRTIYFSLGISLLMMWLTSCSNNDTDLTVPSPDSVKEYITVSFSLEVEGDMNSRSVSDGSIIDELYFQVLDQDGNPSEYGEDPDSEFVTKENNVVVKKDVSSESGVTFPVKFSFVLLRGQSYNISFWAQSSKTTAYDLSNYPKVVVDYTQAKNNDETRDAFFGNIFIPNTVGTNDLGTVTLKRPFAQVNLGAIMDDWIASGIYKMETVKSKVNISDVANVLNVMTGMAYVGDSEGNALVTSATNPATFNLDNIFAADTDDEFLLIDYNNNGVKGEEYTEDSEDEKLKYEKSRYISMCYFLVNPGTSVAGTDNAGVNSALVDLNFELLDENNRTHYFNQNGVPVKRNWRTNIVGSIITSTANIIVDLSPAFEGDINDNVDESVEDQD